MSRAALAAAALCAALLGAAPARASAKGDPLERLQADPSAGASDRLKRLLKEAKTPDQRFWVVQTLGIRAREHKDEAALEALLAALKDPAPLVRGQALRSLTAFDAVGRERVERRWLDRLDTAVKGAERDPAPAVREGARDLKRSLDVFRDPAARGAPAPEDGAKARWRLSKALGFVWVLVLPFSVGLWFLSGRPVFDASSAQGRLAAAAAAELWRRRGLFAFCALLWLGLGALTVGWGFELLVRLLGEPRSEGGAWGAAYLAFWLCLAGPGAFAAAAVAREPEEGGLLAALESGLQTALLCLAAAVVLWPLEVLHAVLWRKGRRAAETRGSWSEMVSEGVLRLVARASAASAEEGVGLVPALMESVDAKAPRLGLAAFDPRFAFLAAAPGVTLLCSFAASAEAAEWTAPKATVLFACTLWAWSVLAALLVGALGAADGVVAGLRHRRKRGLSVPANLEALAAEFPKEVA